MNDWRKILFLLPFFFACKAEPQDISKNPEAQAFLLEEAPRPSHPVEARLEERSGSGAMTYLGFDVTPDGPIQPSSVVELTHYFRVEHPFGGDYQVFVHGDTPAGQRLFTGDHALMNGIAALRAFNPGQIIKDVHKVRIPDAKSGAAVILYVGLFAGQTRATVIAKPGGSDGQDRIRAGRLDWAGGAKDDLPTVTIPRAPAPITADGVLDEDAWSKAVVLSFRDTMDRGTPLKYPTKLRLMYDDDNLYVGFESQDVDVSCPYKNRDDPIYDHETVELFVMPGVTAPELGPYLELQASPSGVIFDASFTGRRRGMDKSFNAGQTIGTKIDGTLNKHDDEDRGWVSEWVVPFSGLKGVDAPPKPGDEWRMNAFRIENKQEFTAWSPPRVGDFHNVDRFGRMKFGE